MSAPHDQFHKQSFFTTPGEYAQLYEGLPNDLKALCPLIKRQFIHPSQIKQFDEGQLTNRRNEEGRFPTVIQMLEGLLERNANGLVMERTPEQRLIVSCRHHALFLASILKTRDIPTRVRVGFAEYVSGIPGKHVDHWICEVWNNEEERWMLVDPDLERVDFAPDEFELAGDVWLKTRAGTVSPHHYGCAPRWGLGPIIDNLCHDFEAVLGYESPYNEGPPLFRAPLSSLRSNHHSLLDFVSEWLQDPDENYDLLVRVQNERPEFKRG